MSHKTERWILGTVLALAAVCGYGVMESETLGAFARHAQTVASVISKQVGPAIQVASAATHGDFEPARAIADAIVKPTNEDVPTDCSTGRSMVAVHPMLVNHRLIVVRVRTGIHLRRHI